MNLTIKCLQEMGFLIEVQRTMTGEQSPSFSVPAYSNSTTNTTIGLPLNIQPYFIFPKHEKLPYVINDIQTKNFGNPSLWHYLSKLCFLPLVSIRKTASVFCLRMKLRITLSVLLFLRLLQFLERMFNGEGSTN